MSEFKREDRYLVLKRKDLELLPMTMQNELDEFLRRANHWLPSRKFAVVESDWQEYEEVFKLLEARCSSINEGDSNGIAKKC